MVGCGDEGIERACADLGLESGCDGRLAGTKTTCTDKVNPIVEDVEESIIGVGEVVEGGCADGILVDLLLCYNDLTVLRDSRKSETVSVGYIIVIVGT